ncbi:flagellar hook-associated protein 2 [Sporosarcina sp. ACRSM]|uniref:flagellar hook-associated protein 2 n=1 Tax=Sporosarcina sp. ACRSM TaxID=2918216 RepID=UPI001EF4F02D|nr:flagellar hook-associated protein 2 [Sporosarcina sp. ACRSM]MCG7334320.1 flagellar hook-associated protein 2 [Sporosarcina sp. ACRSM]
MRISGLATGMDTESIIRDLMKANRIPLDKITQKKQYLEWQLDDYRAVNRQLFDFSQNTFDNMILSKSFSHKTVNVSVPDAVSIKNVSSTSDFSGSIQIHQLAKNATLQSSGDETVRVLEKETDLTQKLSDLGLGVTGVQKIKVTAINAKGVAESKEVEIDTATHTLQSALDKINKETGVTAFYDEHTGKIAITAKHSGRVDNGAKDILIEDVDGTLANSLKINGSSDNGQNADFTFNGLRTQRPSNTFEINGFEVTLKEETAPIDGEGKVIDGGKEITFNSSADTDKIFDNIVKYVDEYNKLIEDLNKQIREPKYRDFHPLSSEQKSEMKEKEIELWEEKAMSGTLRNDSTISSLLTQMRTALMGAVEGIEGDSNTLKSIGITTSKDYLAHGKLVIDEDELRAAISADPNKVHELFAKDGEKAENQGFARRLRTIVDDSQTIIADKAGKVGSVNDTFTLGRNLNDMNKQIERFEDRLKMMEDRYWRQFTAMERAIQRANAQSASLMNAFGGM